MSFTMQTIARRLSVLAFILAAFLPAANPETVFAQTTLTPDATFGYRWRADWNFESDFNGILSIEYGIWEDGDVVEVLETSSTKIGCTPVGSVSLNSGDAVFDGGYLQCHMHLAATVLNNHGLTIDPIDNYGSVDLRARLNSTANVNGPLFVHPNMIYHVDYSQTYQVTSGQLMSNGAGASQAVFPGVAINTWQTYTFHYVCATEVGPCNTTFGIGLNSQVVPSPGGAVQVTTGLTTFTIGGDGGSQFIGRLATIGIDPGNTSY